MSTWSGWENQLLNRAGILVTPPNRQLLEQWARNAHTNCNNNPIDLSHVETGSTQCGTLTGIFAHARNYTTHARAATAFRDEIHQSFAADLLRAMNSGNPYQVSYSNDVASVFVSWGSPKMLNAYLGVASGGGGGGGGGSGGKGIHQGWDDIRRSVNHKSPKALSASDRSIAAALRKLRAARKVRL